MDMGGPDVGDTAGAGVKSLFEGDGHGWWSGGESDALGDRLIVALAELGAGRRAVLICTACWLAGRVVARRRGRGLLLGGMSLRGLASVRL